MHDTPEQIEAAIAALDAQRGLLGDTVAEMAIGPLRETLAAARARSRSGDQQLRPVTILFMDVVGSTLLSRELDPEDVHAVMDGALGRLTAVVEAQHGRVLQYAGDSLLAVFGADQAREDDAERAVHAGLAIIKEAPVLAAQVKARFGLDGFNLRVGINTGPVLLGGGVDAEGSIRGIAVNVAARMEQTAPPGTLRISHDTYRHVRGTFDVKAEPPISVKGIAEPVRSYLVLKARPRAFRMANRGVEGVETRMVGRDLELARLTEAFETLEEERTLWQVTVVGDAGLGKSRLMFEFYRWLTQRQEAAQERGLRAGRAPVTFFHSRPQPHANNVPYCLVRDLFARRFDILDGDPQALARDKLAQGLQARFGERAPEQTALIGHLIGLDYSASPHIAGIVNDAKQIRDRAFHAMAQYFRAQHQAVGAEMVLLLDDLHWADAGSLDFINHLTQSCRDLPLMLLCLARPSLFETRPRWGSGQSNHDRIDLGPLSRRSSRDLADALLSRLATVPPALRDLLTGSAEGNPYFAEELVGMLIDDGVILTATEPWQVQADKLVTVHVPPTLAGVLQARLDGLPPAERTPLQHASVIGHVFWDEALQRIATDAPEASVAALEALQRRELVHGRETSAFEGAHEYVFKHHLLHQVAYDSVLKRDKREQHRRTADWLASRTSERASEYFGLIAEHFERGGDNANAALYFRKAGEDAARSYANVAALDCLGRALALTPDTDAEARFALLLERRAVLSNTGRRGEALADVEALEALADGLDDDARRARAAGLRAAHALVSGDYPGTAAAAAQAVAWAERAGEPEAAQAPHMNWGRALQFQGDTAGAQAHVEQSLALSRQVGDQRYESAALNQMGILALEGGRYAEARDYYEQGLLLARQVNDRVREGSMLNNLGDVERYLGNYAASLEFLRAGREVCREIGQRHIEPYLMCNIAQVQFLRGDLTDTVAVAELAIARARELDDRDLEATLLCIQGHALAASERADDAMAAYAASLAIFREIGRPVMVPEPLAGLARVALAGGRLSDALAQVNEIVAHFDNGGSVDGAEDPMWVYHTCHAVLAAAGSGRAPEFIEQAHALLMARAAPMATDARDSFLGQVPSHKAVMLAWDGLARD